MATYNGLIKAECLDCGYITESDANLEIWNDLGGYCPRCESFNSKWWTTDNTVITVKRIDGDPNADVEVTELPL